MVSGLAKHMPLEALQGARVVLVANLKPANMRGVKSQAMVLAATSPDGSKAGALLRAGTSLHSKMLCSPVWYAGRKTYMVFHMQLACGLSPRADSVFNTALEQPGQRQ